MSTVPDAARRFVRRSWTLRIAAALGLAGGACVAIAVAAGFGAVADAFAAIAPAWLLVVVGGQLVALAGYVVAYKCLVTSVGGPDVPFSLAARLVAVGFGLPAVRGGFGLDRQAVQRLGADHRPATIRVLGLGSLEYLVIAPVAWACALALVIEGSDASMAAPWVVGVPVGTAIAVWAIHHRPPWKGRVWDGVRLGLEGLELMGRLVRQLRPWKAVAGMAVYWAGDAVAMWAALRAFAVHPAFAVVVVGLATGYAATRRTLPLAGAGATELLMPLAYHWLGLALAPALAAVVAYRCANLLGAVVAGLHLREHVEGLIEEQPAEPDAMPSFAPRPAGEATSSS